MALAHQVSAADELLDDLDDTQRRAVTSDAAPLAILAGAGSGKTRVLTRRIAWLIREGRIEAGHTLAVTFTRKAADELVDRLRRLGVDRVVTAGTLHAIALAQLRVRNAQRGRAMPDILERKARILVPLIGSRGPAARLAAANLASEIEWAKARLVEPDDYVNAVARAERDTDRPPQEIAQLYQRYEHEKRRRRVIDFDDLLWWCADALTDDAEFAAAQRWRFRHLFVDEFQDVSPAQVRLLRGWLGERADLCVVGDPDQAIYSFAGADPYFLTKFSKRFAEGQTVRLGCNYRSTPQIVAVAEAVLADGGRTRPPRHAARDSGLPPTVEAYDTDDDEAREIAVRLRAAQSSGVPWSACAVLYRTNAQSAVFEEALTAAAIPFRLRGADRFLDRPEVQVALEELRTSARDAPGRSFLDHIVDLEAREQPALPSHTLPNHTLQNHGGAEQREHRAVLHRLAREYATLEEATASVEGFLAYLVAALRGDDRGATEAVELLTFHRAKGLEFHSVFVTGLERGLVPISHADSPAERAEERRLLYVALTRAETELHMSYARQRTLGARVMPRARSPWLAPIEAAIGGKTVESAVQSAVHGARANLDQARDRLPQAAPTGKDQDDDGADPALLATLVEWRRNLARASGVPAYVIFHDATLRAIATAKPTTPNALLQLSGIGPVKAKRYGDAVFEHVRRHAS